MIPPGKSAGLFVEPVPAAKSDIRFLEITMGKIKLDDKANIEHVLTYQIGAKLPKKVRKKMR